MTKRIPSRILPLIVFSQFAGTSLWFAGNAIITSLQSEFSLSSASLGHVTSAVQLGFIFGTFVFAILSIADRFKPSVVFFSCALLGAIANSAIPFLATGLGSIIVLRFITGFFLAGIYPVGMKIAADWHQQGLGKALGYLVGALVLGTALPHLLRSILSEAPYQYLLYATSIFAFTGGLSVLLFIPEGPHRNQLRKINPRAFFEVFRHKQFRRAAFGYFGHMWELYTFWAFVPVLLMAYIRINPETHFSLSLLSFLIIGIGSLSCIIGGYLSHRFGSDRVAFTALSISGLCCLLVPFSVFIPPVIFILFLLIWGSAVIMDSPQFSTLVAGTAPRESVGTALTIVNGIGFAITIASIQLVNSIHQSLDIDIALTVLVMGPVIGMVSMRKFIREES